ncbi:MAG: hypothetical protein JWR40_4728 [Massilia sp.]|nr:hypothetical protein [Massilia sp.]
MTSPLSPRARLAGLMMVMSAVGFTIAIALPPVPAHARGWSWEKVVGSGRVQTETRSPGHFNGVALDLPADLELRIGATESVTLDTDDNLLPLIETTVENGTLHIRPSTSRLNFDTRRLKIVVQAKAIDKLALGGSGSINADPLRAAKLTINIGGSGSITVKSIDADALSVSLGGSGDLKVGGGAASRLSLSIAGSGDVDLGKLKSVNATVNIAGSGDTTIAARDTLSVTIAGSGDVNYYGDPRVSRTVVGSGSTNRIGGTR